MNIVIYSKDSCPFCVRARDLLTKLTLKFEENKLGKDFDREQIIARFPDAKTFPIITVDGKWIGGYNELEKMLKEHTL